MHNRTSHNQIAAIRLLCLLLILSASALRAESVILRLRNGDRITGHIISENTNEVSISNHWLKAVSIPLAEIESRENPTPALVKQPTTNASVVAKAVVIPAKPAEKPKGPKDWQGDIQIGTDVGISETRRQLYHGRFKITYAPGQKNETLGTTRMIERFRNTFEYNAAYGTVTSDRDDGGSETELSANRMDGSSKTDFDLGKERRVFVYNLVGAGYDEIRKINFRYDLGPGVGYHILNRSNLVLNAEVGMNYQAQYFESDEKSERFYYRLAEDFTWKISKRLTLDEKFEFYPQVNFEEYRLRFESNLRYWLWDNVSFNLTVLDIYDTQSAESVGRNDLQIRSSIGVKF